MNKKIVLSVMFVGIAIIVIAVLMQRSLAPKTPASGSGMSTEPIAFDDISLASQQIAETNFSGTKPVITGTSPLVALANDFISSELAAFRAQADKEVPERAAQYGAGSPPATYTIDIGTTEHASAHTTSLVFDEYKYVGGANGMSTYTAFTIDNADGHRMTIGELIAPDQQDAFVAFVKQALQSGPDKIDGLFPEQVAALSLTDFKNWALTDNRLFIYFDKYAIGAGALGAIAFPIATPDLAPYLANPTLVD